MARIISNFITFVLNMTKKSFGIMIYRIRSQALCIDNSPARDKIFTPVFHKVNPRGCFVIMIARRKKATNYNVYDYPATVLAKENVQIFV